jgi:hypothetical protein
VKYLGSRTGIWELSRSVGWVKDGISALRQREKNDIHVLFLQCSGKQRWREQLLDNKKLRINEEMPTTKTRGSTKIIQLGNTEIDTHATHTHTHTYIYIYIYIYIHTYIHTYNVGRMSVSH